VIAYRHLCSSSYASSLLLTLCTNMIMINMAWITIGRILSDEHQSFFELTADEGQEPCCWHRLGYETTYIVAFSIPTLQKNYMIWKYWKYCTVQQVRVRWAAVLACACTSYVAQKGKQKFAFTIIGPILVLDSSPVENITAWLFLNKCHSLKSKNIIPSVSAGPWNHYT
jgi:hypothetical protein